MNKIQKLSRVLYFIFASGLVFLPLINILVWFKPFGAKFEWVPYGFNIVDLFQASPILQKSFEEGNFFNKILGFAITLVPFSLNIAILLRFMKLFKLYEKLEIFSLKAVGVIKSIGFLLLFKQIAHPFCDALLSLAMTFSNAVGERQIYISIGSAEITETFTALTIILVAHIMEEGRKLKEEQDLVV